MNDEIAAGEPKKNQHKKQRGGKKPTRETAPEFNSVIAPQDETAKTPYRGISRGSAVFLALLSTLAGGALGVGGTMLLGGTGTSEAVSTQLEALSKDASIQAQERIKYINTQTKLLNAVKTSTEKNLVRLNALDTAQQALLAQQEELSKTILGITSSDKASEAENLTQALAGRLDVLEAALPEGAQEASQVMLKRFEALEEQQIHLNEALQSQEQLQAKFDSLTEKLSLNKPFPEPSSEPIEIPKGDSSQEREDTLRILIETFPRAIMLEAVQVQNSIAAKKPSWIQRTLSKHVKVRKEDAASPLALINAAEAALEDGDISHALKNIAQLNPPVRAVAAEWISAAQKAVKSKSDQ